MWSTPTPRSASAPTYRASRARVGRSAIVDLVAGRREDIPLGAELLQALAGRVPGLLVGGVVVERVTVVGHLPLPACCRDRPDLGGEDSGAGLRLLVREQGRPEAQARAGAVAHVRLVGFEQVQRAPVRVDEDLPERGGANVDGRFGGGPGGGHGRRLVGLARPAARERYHEC